MCYKFQTINTNWVCVCSGRPGRGGRGVWLGVLLVTTLQKWHTSTVLQGRDHKLEERLHTLLEKNHRSSFVEIWLLAISGSCSRPLCVWCSLLSRFWTGTENKAHKLEKYWFRKTEPLFSKVCVLFAFSSRWLQGLNNLSVNALRAG